MDDDAVIQLAGPKFHSYVNKPPENTTIWYAEYGAKQIIQKGALVVSPRSHVAPTPPSDFGVPTNISMCKRTPSGSRIRASSFCLLPAS